MDGASEPFTTFCDICKAYRKPYIRRISTLSPIPALSGFRPVYNKKEKPYKKTSLIYVLLT